jgi:hypothetical protein
VVRAQLKRAVTRGEVPMPPSLIFHRRIVVNEPMDRAYICTLIDQIILPPAAAAVSTSPMSAASGR